MYGIHLTLMSRGLSRQQRAIVELLSGKRKGQAYATAAGGLDTAELLEELKALGLVNEDAPRKQQMHTILRACDCLISRGLLIGKNTIECDAPCRKTVAWSFKAPPEGSTVHPEPGKAES